MKRQVFRFMFITQLLLASTVYASEPLSSNTSNPVGTSESWFGQMRKFFGVTTDETTTSTSTFDSVDRYETEKISDSSFRAKLRKTPEASTIAPVKYTELSSQKHLLDNLGDNNNINIETLKDFTTISN